jgi:hypothetical protein
MLFNVPTNSLEIGSIDLHFHTEKAGAPMGTLTAEQWTALLTIIQPFAPPPLGTKQV